MTLVTLQAYKRLDKYPYRETQDGGSWKKTARGFALFRRVCFSAFFSAAKAHAKPKFKTFVIATSPAHTMSDRPPNNQPPPPLSLSCADMSCALLDHAAKQNSLAACREALAKHDVFHLKLNHAFRQPLHGMAMMVSVLSESGKSCAVISWELERALRSMQRLLDISLRIIRLDAVGKLPALCSINLSSLVRTEVERLRPLAADNKTQLEFLGADSVFAYTDPTLTADMAARVLENAVRFSPGAAVIASVSKRPDGRVRLRVFDQGTGMAAEQRTRMLEDFYKYDPKGLDKGYGYGLGLSLVTRIARMLNTPLSVRSRLGRGTCFTIYFA